MNYHDVSLSVAQSLLRSQAGDSAPREAEHGFQAPSIITISREVGALGSSTAAEVGRRLGWPVYDREILTKIAEQMQRPGFALSTVDEHPPSWLEQCLEGLLAQSSVTPSAYLKYLVGTVRGLGAEGRSVIVGRGAHCILPPERTFRVRLVADRPARVGRVRKLKGLSEADAALYVDKYDREREQFVRMYFGRDPADPHGYDLVLNTTRMTADDCAAVIVDALRQLEARDAERRPVSATR